MMSNKYRARSLMSVLPLFGALALGAGQAGADELLAPRQEIPAEERARAVQLPEQAAQKERPGPGAESRQGEDLRPRQPGGPGRMEQDRPRGGDRPRREDMKELRRELRERIRDRVGDREDRGDRQAARRELRQERRERRQERLREQRLVTGR
jgi:hypothetical protein